MNLQRLEELLAGDVERQHEALTQLAKALWPIGSAERAAVVRSLLRCDLLEIMLRHIEPLVPKIERELRALEKSDDPEVRLRVWMALSSNRLPADMGVAYAAIHSRHPLLPMVIRMLPQLSVEDEAIPHFRRYIMELEADPRRWELDSLIEIDNAYAALATMERLRQTNASRHGSEPRPS